MTSGQTASELAILAVFCILSIFLFPAIQGPYSAVHGPVTALQAARAAVRLRLAIVQSALKAAQFSLLASFVAIYTVGWTTGAFRPVQLTECDGILRC